MDPLREDLALLASDAPLPSANGAARSNGKRPDDGLKAVATNPTTKASPSPDAAASNAPNASSRANANVEAPQWLAERMNDPQHSADARALWDGVQLARQEASAFREVFAKPEDARAAAQRARTLDEIDRAYFGAAGNAPEQTSASRAQLATQMMREDPAAFREMVFAGLRALEEAAQAAPKQGSASHAPSSTTAFATQSQTSVHAETVAVETVAPPFRAASSAANQPAAQSSPASQTSPSQLHAQAAHATQQQHEATRQQHEAQRQQEVRLAAYATFERAANEDLERTVRGAISRTLQEALPHAARTENGEALKERLSGAIRQDVEKSLQGDRDLGEQVARILSGQRLDNAARAQVVRLIGDRAQQLVPSATRRVLADCTQTTLSTHGTRANRNNAAPPQNTVGAATKAGTRANTSPVHENTVASRDRTREVQRGSIREAATIRSARKIDYRRISDEDILDS